MPRLPKKYENMRSVRISKEDVHQVHFFAEQLETIGKLKQKFNINYSFPRIGGLSIIHLENNKDINIDICFDKYKGIINWVFGVSLMKYWLDDPKRFDMFFLGREYELDVFEKEFPHKAIGNVLNFIEFSYGKDKMNIDEICLRAGFTL